MRDQLSDNIRKLILGPVQGVDEELSFKPLNLYSTGVLYPQIEKCIALSDTNIVEEQDNPGDSESENHDEDTDKNKESESTTPKGNNEDRKEIEEFDDDLKLATNFAPSSLGISFLINSQEEFILEYSFARYIKKIRDRKVSWKRKVYNEEIKCIIDETNKLLIDGVSAGEKKLVDEEKIKVNLNLFVRQLNEIKLVTVTLINAQHVDGFQYQKNDELCVFQPELKVRSLKAVFNPFPDNKNYDNLENDHETLNSSLLYYEYRTYAMGHGVSVNWSEPDIKSKNVDEIWAEVMPTQMVNGVNFNPDELNSDVLLMKKLAGPDFNQNTINDREIRIKLEDFAHTYNDWIEKQYNLLEKREINKQLKKQGERNLNKCKELYERLLRGIELIFHENNSKVLQAFYDANKAMFMQRVMGQFSTWRREKGNVIPGTKGYEDVPLPNFELLPANGQNESKNNFGFFAKWRPFQLAFILSQIEGIINPNSKDRDTTDLIWFPTGGGKTEAYLGLIAFTLFYRRLRHDNPNEGAGVSVMMRYTLRMLNLDQFQRANILISACDIIRYNNVQDYGTKRFTSGIWVGSSLTPNRYESYGDRKDGYNSNLDDYINNIEFGDNKKVYYSPFLYNCPCCGNTLVKQRIDKKTVTGAWGYFRKFRKKDGINSPKGNYLVACTNTSCHFFTEQDTRGQNFNLDKTFPFYTVDDEIYQQRPSLLFATVDKYAQIGWKKESASLFNLDVHNNNVKLNPGPELIIQDELHLIGASLGTIYGVFEFAIDKLCTMSGSIPKIIGATATVKNAEEQCKRLYNRSNFMQFPPPGISADDSFYMKRKEHDEKARKYIGFMSSGFTSSTSIIRLSSVLMETPNFLKFTNKTLDAYYTLLVYFNSLKELGKFRTFIDDDISAYRKFLDNTVLNIAHQNYAGRDIELSSAMDADDITNALERLKKAKLEHEKLTDNILETIESKGIRSFLDWFQTTNKKTTLSKPFLNSIGIQFVDDYSTDKTAFENKLEDYFSKEKKNNTVKIATATNMIATGVDISRLNVMLVNGHPKSSSEYIQSSSRVGREDSGLIYSFYSATKNRDRSHYENFKSFHQAFYKYVEPASVTPHSMPALEKVLPSIIIGLIWIVYNKSNNQPFVFDDKLNDFIDKLKIEIRDRLGDEVQEYLETIVNTLKTKWKNFGSTPRRFANFRAILSH